MLQRIVLALTALTLVACVAGVVPGEDTAQSDPQDKALNAGNSAYLIVTRQDTRRCRYPLCGGYFVKGVNLKLTRCADGVSRAECHVVDVDLSATGLNPEEGARFTNGVFGARQGLVRGSLQQRKSGAGDLADTLVGREAWQGQARSVPRGTFMGLRDSGIRCITHPCNSIAARVLNGRRTALFAGVNLAASGASQGAVDAGNAALASGELLAAGASEPVRGPAGVRGAFRASEFYLRVVSEESACEPQDATGTGQCQRFFGYAWDGAACTGVSGCSCQGADCDALVMDRDECQAVHAECVEPACGTRGGVLCAKDEYCDFTAGSMCGAADEGGVCRKRPTICATIHAPVCGCDGATYSNKCSAAGAGVDVSHDGPCE